MSLHSLASTDFAARSMTHCLFARQHDAMEGPSERLRSRQNELPGRRRVKRRTAQRVHPSPADRLLNGRRQARAQTTSVLRRIRSIHPVGDDVGDGFIIALHHHHVGVAMDPDIAKSDVRHLEAGLLQILHRTLIIWRMIRSLRRHDENRDAGEVDELTRRLLLPPATDQICPVRLIGADKRQRRFACRRPISSTASRRAR